MSAVVRIASLPMYDADRDAVQAWWDGIARAMRIEGIAGVPAALDWPSDLGAHWREPRLLISQTCGYPLATQLGGVVQVLGAFRYTAPGCTGYLYRSELLARMGTTRRNITDFRGAVAAINDRQSYSGYHALCALAAPLERDGPFFAREVESGSHRNSLALLRDEQADIAAIDCISLAGLRRHAPAILLGLEVIGATAAAPGLPLVTSAGTSAADVRALRRALGMASEDPALADAREALFIDGFEIVPASAWNPLAASAGGFRSERS